MLRYSYRKQRSEDQRPWIPKPSELPPDWRECGAPHHDRWIIGTDLSAWALAARWSSLRRIWMSRRITRNGGNVRAADHRKDHVAFHDAFLPNMLVDGGRLSPAEDR